MTVFLGAQMGAVVQLEDVSFENHGDVIFRDLTLALDPGDIVAVTGPNGSGKTTLIKCLLGILRWSGGRCVNLPSKGSISYVPQRWSADSVFPLDVDGVLRMGLFTGTMNLDTRQAFGIEPLLKRAFIRLSLGQQKKILVVRALERNPKLLVMDEPFAGLDNESSLTLIEMLRRSAAAGAAVILASHESPWIEQLQARIFNMSAGGES